MAMRPRGNAAFAARGTSVTSSPVCRRPRFIQKDQLRDIQSGRGGLPLTPCGLHVGAISLAGVEGFS
jgi:hypothetical protein